MTRHTILETQEAQHPGRWSTQQISVRVFSLDREKYTQIPEFQREQVWTAWDEKLFIDGMLRGIPVLPIIAYKIIGSDGDTKYGVIDGQNRLAAIWRFKDDKFATATVSQMKAREPIIRPIEPGRTYSQLSPKARNIFDDIQLIIYSGEDIDLVFAGLIYRWGNKGKHLNLAETVYSYMSDMTKLANRIGNHPFWKEIYTGKVKRKERFRGGLHIAMMEYAKKPVAQHSTQLHEWASGMKDSLITEDFIQSIFTHLDEAIRIYSGVKLEKPYEVIVLYQALLFLEKWGYSLSRIPTGCLTSWFTNFQTQVNREHRYQGVSSKFTELFRLEVQRSFWSKHKPTIEAIVKAGMNNVIQERIFI